MQLKASGPQSTGDTLQGIRGVASLDFLCYINTHGLKGYI
jgi:hypothetical protein